MKGKSTNVLIGVLGGAIDEGPVVDFSGAADDGAFFQGKCGGAFMLTEVRQGRFEPAMDYVVPHEPCEERVALDLSCVAWACAEAFLRVAVEELQNVCARAEYA
jgi:hypothetical protein